MSKLVASKATVKTVKRRTDELSHWRGRQQLKTSLYWASIPRLLTWRYPHLLLSALRRVPAIDRSLLHAPALSSKPAACRWCFRSTRQTDGWTDGRTPDRYIDPALHNLMSMWSLRWHFTNKSVTGAPHLEVLKVTVCHAAGYYGEEYDDFGSRRNCGSDGAERTDDGRAFHTVPSSVRSAPSLCGQRQPGARFTKYLTIYHTIIASLS